MPNLWTSLFAFVTSQWDVINPHWRGSSTSRDESIRREEVPSWHQYVRASEFRTIYPARVIPDLTRGDVANPSGLINGEGGPTVFTRASTGDEAPSVTVDFGQNTVGIVSISFAGSSSTSTSGTVGHENDERKDQENSSSRPGIRLAFSETLQFLSNVSDFSRSYNGDTITPGSDQIAVAKDAYTWTARHGCQYPGEQGKGQVCADGLHGFRYLRIYLDALPSDAPHTTPQGQVNISSVSLALSAYHGTPDTFRGWFECSDEELTRWWFDGVYTNDLCVDEFRGAEDAEPRGAASETLEGKIVLHDAPKRDRDPYVGDLAVAALTGYVSHGKGTLSEASRNVLVDLAVHQRGDGWIPPASIMNYTLPLFDYPLWWVVCSHDYVWYTGDVEYISTYYANLVAVLDGWYVSVTDQETGLVTKGLNGTSGYGDYAFLPRQGPVTYYNALYVLALRRAAEMAAEIEKEADAERWGARADDVASTLARRNFDAARGAFWDGTDGAGEFVAAHAQDGNSLAILAGGVVDTSTARGILAYYAGAASRTYGNAFYDSDAVGQGFSQRVYAFISYFEMAARFASGVGETAVEEMRRLYGWMAGQDPGVTFWEGIGGPDGQPYEDGFTSMAHGWSTGVVPLMSGHVLGVKPTGPGFRTWSVVPEVSGLKWARGVVPTPEGEGIRVEWEDLGKGEGVQFRIVVWAARGTRGVVGVPVRARDVVVDVDGRVVYRGRDGVGARFEGEKVWVEVEGGDGVDGVAISVRLVQEGL
ncbi:alpha-L-rhamnosidase A [Colletotrichum scovillei]|uniref:Alpha-L-rhamnosidase A n=1 Tax=Colletotrichum scovillei TaxID=1209932 RepID=A0A9P7QQN1_9PEZI|nr:alpha-L-rhamnosidase A [Colletotrichum scovillei]KAG7041029.1 alpha-L-rhamnosidase A [Colletotrichum scovillei]KAG7061062.1 alpha-L-rhamnosidase A [Colletotrichum scovillei]